MASKSPSEANVPSATGSGPDRKSVHAAGTIRVLPSGSTRISSSRRRRCIQPLNLSEQPSHA